VAATQMPGNPKTSNPPAERRLAALLAVEIDVYPVLMRDDDDAMHFRVGRELDVLRAAIRRASGTVLSFVSDGMMAEFASATEAVRCALGIQADAARRMQEATEPVRFRIGINVGEILAGGRHVGGSAINFAAGLAGIAPPGGIALTGALHDQIRHAVAVPVTPVGYTALRGDRQRVAVVGVSSEACLAWAGQPAPRRGHQARPMPDPRASLAVVPFQADEPHNRFAGSATDDVIRAFGGLATWLAVTRTEDAAIRAPIDLSRLRQTSDARYILHGAVETEREMLRLAVELNEAETGRVLWSDRFDRMLGEPAELRQDAACRIARAIPPLLLQRELDRTALPPPGELTAHDLALRAFAAVMQPDSDSLRLADDLLSAAGPHVSVHFVRVWWHLMALSQGCDTGLGVAAAGAGVAAMRDAAGGMDRDDPAAAALLGYLQSVLHRDHALASALLDRVIDSSPACALAWTLKSLTLCRLDEGLSAIFHAEQAQTMPLLGPERAWRDHVTALAHYIAGRYGDAVRWARVSAMQHGGLAANARVLAASLAVLGQLDEARRAGSQVLAIDPAFRIGAWRERSLLPEDDREVFAQRLRLAGLPA
jgi:adenylate cyclase